VTVEIQLVTDDIELVAIVGAHLASYGTVRVVALGDAGATQAAAAAPIVLVDVRQLNPAVIRRARVRSPHALYVAIISPRTGPREPDVEGAIAVVAAEGAAIAACCASLIKSAAS
jgi:hypothetical protein